MYQDSNPTYIYDRRWYAILCDCDWKYKYGITVNPINFTQFCFVLLLIHHVPQDQPTGTGAIVELP